MFQNIRKLKEAYRNHNVEDIDLFVGMIMEDATDGPIGDTFRCLIVDVFSRMRYGDRYFYDNAGQAGSFTPSKLFYWWIGWYILEIFFFFFRRSIATNSESVYGKNIMWQYKHPRSSTFGLSKSG